MGINQGRRPFVWVLVRVLFNSLIVAPIDHPLVFSLFPRSSAISNKSAEFVDFCSLAELK